MYYLKLVKDMNQIPVNDSGGSTTAKLKLITQGWFMFRTIFIAQKAQGWRWINLGMTVGILNLAAMHRFTKAETVPSCVFVI